MTIIKLNTAGTPNAIFVINTIAFGVQELFSRLFAIKVSISQL
ncbi:hypothetical protein [Listeria farberi]|nr:hypothetical protein [Listeria farberi]